MSSLKMTRTRLSPKRFSHGLIVKVIRFDGSSLIANRWQRVGGRVGWTIWRRSNRSIFRNHRRRYVLNNVGKSYELVAARSADASRPICRLSSKLEGPVFPDPWPRSAFTERASRRAVGIPCGGV